MPSNLPSIYAVELPANHPLDESEDEGVLPESDVEMEDESTESDVHELEATTVPKTKPRTRKSRSQQDEDHNPRSFGREPQPYKFSYENPLDFNSKPLSTIPEFFEDITDKIKTDFDTELRGFCNKFGKTPLNVVTFCSGTESPILAIGLVQKRKFNPLIFLIY